MNHHSRKLRLCVISPVVDQEMNSQDENHQNSCRSTSFNHCTFIWNLISTLEITKDINQLPQTVQTLKNANIFSCPSPLNLNNCNWLQSSLQKCTNYMWTPLPCCKTQHNKLKPRIPCQKCFMEIRVYGKATSLDLSNQAATCSAMEAHL